MDAFATWIFNHRECTARHGCFSLLSALFLYCGATRVSLCVVLCLAVGHLKFYARRLTAEQKAEAQSRSAPDLTLKSFQDSHPLVCLRLSPADQRRVTPRSIPDSGFVFELVHRRGVDAAGHRDAVRRRVGGHSAVRLRGEGFLLQ